MRTFEYDPFQKTSIEAINQNHSVLVSAPTGAGKTAIADYAVEVALKKGERVIYTAPIKAISNQKFRDFSLLFPTQTGIVTGDVSINPKAPLVIMTTEIYRNQLFDEPDRHRDTAWVIFDEVHYLDDVERGTVWEEAIMFSMPHTRFVALSATAPNVKELADWIRSIHNHPVTVVIESHRPVRLVHHFQCQNIIHADLPTLRRKGYMGHNQISVRGMGTRNTGRRYRGGRQAHHDVRILPNRIDDLLKHLIDTDKMPCLYFAFGRKRVEELAQEHTRYELIPADAQEENVNRFDELSEKYGLRGEKSADRMRLLVRKGIAFHHAGLLPTLKEVVEQLFTEKRIYLIFTTETFALGINMPARTVVFDELRKFYGFGFDQLTTRDYYQMAGRAGRRGLDPEGYVYSRVNPRFMTFGSVSQIVDGSMEPIRSQFNASYATLLNLYKHMGPQLVRVYPRSFHYFRSNKKKQKRALLNLERKIDLLTEMGYIRDKAVTQKGEFASYMYGYELMLSELWESGLILSLDPTGICVLLAALIYEPRKGEEHAETPKKFETLEKECRTTILKIHRSEEHHHVFPLSQKPHFNLAKIVEAWMGGCEFRALTEITDIDEGVIIRYFRMVIQLLRQLAQDPHTPEALKVSIRAALTKINRDIVDAEKLLRNL